ncbi:MAG: hypothetical protein NVS3B10_19070 [Polyangiales bacterium]
MVDMRGTLSLLCGALLACGGAASHDGDGSDVGDAGQLADATPETLRPDAPLADAGEPRADAPRDTASTDALDATPETSAGCGTTGAPTGDLAETLTVAGETRRYDVVVPADYAAGKPLPLVFVFHYATGTIAAAKNYGIQKAPGAHAIFVFPQGTVIGGRTGWDESCTGKDVALVDQIKAKIAATYCIDEKRVFAAGFSWGADFTIDLGCCRGSELRALSAASGSGTQPIAKCTAPSPAFRFTYQPGGDAYYSAADFARPIGEYRALDGCSTTSASTSIPACASYDGCVRPVVECKYPGLGHGMPPGWGADTWAFFASFG